MTEMIHSLRGELRDKKIEIGQLNVENQSLKDDYHSVKQNIDRIKKGVRKMLELEGLASNCDSNSNTIVMYRN